LHLAVLWAIVHETVAHVYGINLLRRGIILQADAPTAADFKVTRALGDAFGTTGA
jgi:hypothetical protein